MSNSGLVSFATGAEVLSYIGAGTGSGSVESITVAAGALIDVSGDTTITTSGTVTVGVDLSELTDMTATMVGTDEFVVLDSSAQRRKAANEIGLSIFSNDSGFGTGNVSNTGTPVNNQIAIWTNATTIEGDSDLTFDGSNLTTTGVINASGGNINRME